MSRHLTRTGACAQVVTLTHLMDILSLCPTLSRGSDLGAKGFASQWSKCLFLSIPHLVGLKLAPLSCGGWETLPLGSEAGGRCQLQ